MYADPPVVYINSIYINLNLLSSRYVGGVWTLFCYSTCQQSKRIKFKAKMKMWHNLLKYLPYPSFNQKIKKMNERRIKKSKIFLHLVKYTINIIRKNIDSSLFFISFLMPTTKFCFVLFQKEDNFVCVYIVISSLFQRTFT